MVFHQLPQLYIDFRTRRTPGVTHLLGLWSFSGPQSSELIGNQWFSNSSVHLRHLEGWLKHRTKPPSQGSCFTCLGWYQGICSPSRFLGGDDASGPRTRLREPLSCTVLAEPPGDDPDTMKWVARQPDKAILDSCCFRRTHHGHKRVKNRAARTIHSLSSCASPSRRYPRLRA